MSVARPVVADVAVSGSVDTSRTERELAEPRWWRTALVALIGAAGLLVVSEALLYSRSHTGSGEAQFWFWVGLLAIVLPCTALLAGRTATRTERVVAVVVLAVLLYLVKVVHDPFTFTYSDEWVHAFNAKQVLGTGALYHSNPIVPVSARYPGLEAATSAIATMTGLSVFVSGLILVGAARLVGALALFHLLERLTSSERIAGIGVLVYAANPNFLFWGVQYSYESLALPLVFLTLLAASAATGPPRAAADSGTGTLADVVAGERPERLGWALAALLSISAVVVTHHVSAFILSGSLILVCLVAQVSRAGRTQAPWLLAAYSTAATLAWLFVVAPQTVGYLTPVLAGAFHQTVGALLGHVHGRAPFSNGGGAGSSGGLPATVAPFWQRAVTIASIGLITVSVVVGLFELRRRRTRNAYAIALGLAGLAYVAVLPMRLVPAAWETSNRASEFLFAGVALLVALAATRIWSRPRLFAVGATCAVAVIFVGGVVAGWPPRGVIRPSVALCGTRSCPPESTR